MVFMLGSTVCYGLACVCVHACVSVLLAQSCLTLCDPIDCSLPGSLSMEFSRQEYWSGLPLPSPGDLPDPGIEPRSPALWADSLRPEPPGKPYGLAQEGAVVSGWRGRLKNRLLTSL